MKSFLSTGIEALPFGWNDLYQIALSQYPNGKIFAGLWNMPSIGIYDTQVTAYFTNPVAFREMLIREYRKHQQNAIMMSASYHRTNDHSLVGGLVLEDMMLYNLASEWCTPYRSPEDAAPHFLDPEKYLADFEQYNPDRAYFAEHFVEPWQTLSNYRLIDWFLDFSDLVHRNDGREH